MTTKGLTRRQIQEGVTPRIHRITKAYKNQLDIEHKKLEDFILDDCYIGTESWVEYFENWYLAEYHPFSKTFVLTRRIKSYHAGHKLEYSYQVVYKRRTNKGVVNAPSPVREYLKEVNRKIDEAMNTRADYREHLKKHLELRIQEKHLDSLRAYIQAKKNKGEIK